MSDILELKLLKTLKSDSFKILDKSTLEILIDLFYIHKNFEIYNLLNKELDGYSNTDLLPEYRKNIKVIATKRFVDGKKSYNQINEEVEGSYIGSIIQKKQSDELWKTSFIFDEKNIGGLIYENIHNQVYSKLNPIIICEIEKIISNNFK